MVEKGVDITLALDMAMKAFMDHYDIAIIVSGDGDFAKAVQVVKNTGRKVEMAYLKKPWKHLERMKIILSSDKIDLKLEGLGDATSTNTGLKI